MSVYSRCFVTLHFTADYVLMGKSSVTSNLCNLCIIVWAKLAPVLDLRLSTLDIADNLNLDQFSFFAANKQDNQREAAVPGTKSSSSSWTSCSPSMHRNHHHHHKYDHHHHECSQAEYFAAWRLLQPLNLVYKKFAHPHPHHHHHHHRPQKNWLVCLDTYCAKQSKFRLRCLQSKFWEDFEA